MTDRRLDERFKIEGDPEDALRGLLGADTEQAKPTVPEPCPKLDPMGKQCKAAGGKGHFGPCQYDA